MNVKFLVISSFLIALLFHVAFFNGITLTFPIGPETPKPKLFFLGPILTQKEVKHAATDDLPANIQTFKKDIVIAADSLNGKLNNGDNEDKNPFSITAINKPLAPQTEKTYDKADIKSTFETEPMMKRSGEEQTEPIPDDRLNIQPYRSLRFRNP